MPRFLPTPSPDTAHFWEGCRRGELLLQRCRVCAHVYFPPRPFCAKCAHRDVEAFAASGRAVLWSYVINHRPRPDMGKDPYAIAVVKLDEGPTMMTNIVGCEQTPEALKLDMPLRVSFSKQSEAITLPLFAPS
jgi:uncharacterized OB-fold protein